MREVKIELESFADIPRGYPKPDTIPRGSKQWLLCELRSLKALGVHLERKDRAWIVRATDKDEGTVAGEGGGLMARGRGNKSGAAAIAKRRRKIAKMAADGMDKAEIGEVMGIDKSTLWRDFLSLDQAVLRDSDTVELYRTYKERQRQELEHLKKLTVGSADFSDKERVAALLQINDRLVTLLGLDSPELSPKPDAESITVNIKFEDGSEVFPFASPTPPQKKLDVGIEQEVIAPEPKPEGETLE